MALPADASKLDQEAVQDVLDDTYLALLPPEQVQVIWDIGAHVGAASLYFREYYPEAEIVAWEPDPRSYICLIKNTHNDTRMVLRNCAVSPEGGKQVLYGREEFGYVCHSLVSSQFADKPVARVQCDTPASLCRRNLPQIIKLDIEGGEIPVLRGLAQILPQVPAVYVEYHSEADRRELDDIFTRHTLVQIRSSSPHRGVSFYVKDEHVSHVLEI